MDLETWVLGFLKCCKLNTWVSGDVLTKFFFIFCQIFGIFDVYLLLRLECSKNKQTTCLCFFGHPNPSLVAPLFVITMCSRYSFFMFLIDVTFLQVLNSIDQIQVVDRVNLL